MQRLVATAVVKRPHHSPRSASNLFRLLISSPFGKWQVIEMFSIRDEPFIWAVHLVLFKAGCHFPSSPTDFSGVKIAVKKATQEVSTTELSGYWQRNHHTLITLDPKYVHFLNPQWWKHYHSFGVVFVMNVQFSSNSNPSSEGNIWLFSC